MLLGADETVSGVEFKALIYGNSGAGKTTLGVTAPKPLFLLAERQGYQSVRAAAQRLGVPIPPTFYVSDVRQLIAASAILRDAKDPTPIKTLAAKLYPGTKLPPLPYDKPETIVLDSVTEFFQLVSDGIDAITGVKKGRDGLPTKPERYWGVLSDQCWKMIRDFRDLPYHVLFLALMDDRTIETENSVERVVGPLAPMRKIPGRIAAAVNAVGAIHSKMVRVEGEQDKRHVHEVYFTGPEFMLTKPFRPLRDEEEADFGKWIQTLKGCE